jgi:2-dehydropantoate 2-reductase
MEVLREPGVASLAGNLLTEAVAVGRAEGAALADESAGETLTWLQRLAPETPSSMLQDMRAGRALEFDGITGTVVRLGESHGVPVEANRSVLALLSALRPASPGNPA